MVEQDSGRVEPNISLKNHENCTVDNCISTNQYKCKTIAGIYSKPDTYIDSYRIFHVDNVRTIDIVDRADYSWDIEYDTEITSGDKDYYFYIEQVYQDVFGHWVFESAINLPLFKKLKSIYPELKLLIFKNNIKKYKKLFCNSFKIDESDIIYSIQNPNNTIIFPGAISMADHSLLNVYNNYVINFKNALTCDIPINVNKDISILYMPRGTTENYIANDRTIAVQKELIEHIKSINNSLVYFGDAQTENFADQIKLIKRSNILIVSEGSAHSVNGLFSENSKIIVVGDFNRNDTNNPRPDLIIQNMINNNNKIYYISGYTHISDMIRYINDVINNNTAPNYYIPYSHSRCWKKRCVPCNKL